MRARRLLTATLVILASLAVPASVAPASAGGGCHRPSTEGTGTTVHLKDACMSPTVLRTDVGSTVTFVNDDPFAHNVTGNPLYADLPAIGDATSLRYPGPGTFPYTCTLHPGMNGVVVVGDGIGSMAQPQLIAATSPAAAAAVPSTDDEGKGTRGIPWPAAALGAAVLAIAAAAAGRRSVKPAESAS